MNLLDELKKLNSQIVSLNDQPIVNSENQIVGWNSYFQDSTGKTIAGGTSTNKEKSKTIAIAECFEREFFKKLIQEQNTNPLLFLNESPSTSGFAAGFESKSTAFRSICEAIERWAWSKWIDEGFELLPSINQNQKSDLYLHITNQFDSVQLYKIELIMNFDFSFPKKLNFTIFLGYKDSGIFPGSRVTSLYDNPWEHSAIEAYRNLKNYEFKTLLTHSDTENIVGQRSRFFAENAELANEQIKKANKKNWPDIKLKTHTSINTKINGLFLYRTLCEDYLQWHLGKIDRFVY